MGGFLSEQGVVKHGIPQGVLSGPLFLVYINNLCNGCFKGKLVDFLDDFVLFYETESIKSLKLNLQCDVDALNWWFMRNLMVMSPKYIGII